MFRNKLLYLSYKIIIFLYKKKFPTAGVVSREPELPRDRAVRSGPQLGRGGVREAEAGKHAQQ